MYNVQIYSVAISYKVLHQLRWIQLRWIGYRVSSPILETAQRGRGRRRQRHYDHVMLSQHFYQIHLDPEAISLVLTGARTWSRFDQLNLRSLYL